MKSYTDMMTAAEVAQELGCCKETIIRKYIKTGRLTALKCGHGYRIPASSYRTLKAELFEEQLVKVQKKMRVV